MSYREIAALPIFLCFTSLSCSRSNVPGQIERLAILPIENLTSDTGLDWISNAGSAILAYDLIGLKNIHSLRVATLNDARAGRATRYLEAYFAIERGSLAFHVTIEDAEKVKAVRTFVIKSPPGEVAGAIDRLAKELSGDARHFPSCNTAALRLYGDALGERGTLEAAYQADPNCAALSLAWAEALLAKADREGVARVCTASLALTNLHPIDRTQFEYLNASAKGERAARLNALERLVSLMPADAALMRIAATLQLADRNVPAALRDWEAAAQADPGDPLVWNELGHDRAYNHDLDDARRALEQYQKMLPPGGWERSGLAWRGQLLSRRFCGHGAPFPRGLHCRPRTGGIAQSRAIEDDGRRPR